MVKNLIPWRKKDRALARASSGDGSLERLHQQINELFDEFFEGFGSHAGPWPSLRGLDRDWSSFIPRFEVSETDDEVRVKAEIPGMEEKDIEVVLDENVLTIRGEKKDEREQKRRNYVTSELSYGQFHRSIQLPAGIDRDNAKAKFKRGVLTLTLPKTEQARERRKRIEVDRE
jgi:HSP20 family protein